MPSGTCVALSVDVNLSLQRVVSTYAPFEPFWRNRDTASEKRGGYSMEPPRQLCIPSSLKGNSNAKFSNDGNGRLNRKKTHLKSLSTLSLVLEKRKNV